MAEIKTFVFFDIETTDLIINGVLPKIAELSFIACSREHFLDADTRKVPRTLPKLVLPVSPVKRIHPMATFKNGLGDDTAEADSLILLMCSIAIKNKFVDLVDSMAVRFNSAFNYVN